jgi:hypothetical protein
MKPQASFLPSMGLLSMTSVSLIIILGHFFIKLVPPLEDKAYQAGLEWQKSGITDGLVFPDFCFTSLICTKIYRIVLFISCQIFGDHCPMR